MTALWRWRQRDGRFQCPRHESQYQPDGTFIQGRATRNMDRLQISREGTLIVVDPDVAFESDVDPAKWAAAVLVGISVLVALAARSRDV